METKGKGFGAIRGYAGGGLIAGIKGMLGMKTETVTEKFARQDAEFRAKHPQPAAPASAPAKAPTQGNTAIGDYAGMTALQKREKAAGLKAGGMVKKKCVEGGQIEGPGGPTDDLVPIMASNGEFMIKASSAKILGPELLEALNDVGGKEEPKKGDKLKVGGMIRKMSEGGTVNRYHSTIDDAINAEVKPPKPGSDLSSKFGMIKAIGRDAASMFDLKEGTTGTNTAMETTKQVAPVSPVVAGAGRGIASAASMAVNPYATTPPVAPSAPPTVDDSAIAATEAQKRASGQQGVAYNLNDPASNASILAQNPAGAVRRVGNSYSGANVSGNVGFVGADGNPISGRPGGGLIQGIAQSQATPDGSQWSSGDNAIMAANIRDGIDPTRGTSRGTPGGASIIGGPAIPGGDPNDLLSANHEAMRRANIAATRSGYRPEDKAMRAAGVGLIAGLGQQFGQAKQDQQANARTAMTIQAQQAQTDAASRNQVATNQIAQAQLGLNRQKQTQDNALARDKLATDSGMEKIRQQLWAAYTSGTPEQKAQAAEQWAMLSGKTQKADEYATDVVTDDKGVQRVVATNKRTGLQGGQSAVAIPDAATARAQALAALKVNPANKDEINKRLAAAGYQPI